jgi:3-oxo-5alpha-steroid 4-dehydrogenase
VATHENVNASVFPRSVGDIKSWDATTDVVVVGFGCAGASAAIAARTGGADTIVLERAGGPGGASAMSGGLIYLGGGTPVQRACGFADTAENMYRFLKAACGPGEDDARIAQYCDGSVAHFEWLNQMGVKFNAQFFDHHAGMALTDDGLMFSGGELSYPFREIASPVPRGHVPVSRGEAGWVLMESLSKAAVTAGAAIRYDTAAERLITDSDRRVVGVEARQYGRTVTIRAKLGVVLCSGGFIFNDDMLGLYAPDLLDNASKTGTEYDDGRVIRMAQAAGASLRNMSSCEVTTPAAMAIAARSLLVDGTGQRFVNEDAYGGRLGLACRQHRRAGLFLVYDQHVHEQYLEERKALDVDNISPLAADVVMPRATPTWVCDTLDELEDSLGVPAGSLVASIGLYNKFAADGDDPLFHKEARWLQPLRAPYGAIDLRGEDYRMFTLGGLHVLPSGEVLDLDGEAITGLFAAGRTSAGIPASNYVSGISLGDGTFFGRVAGASAAAGQR